MLCYLFNWRAYVLFDLMNRGVMCHGEDDLWTNLGRLLCDEIGNNAHAPDDKNARNMEAI